MKRLLATSLLATTAYTLTLLAGQPVSADEAGDVVSAPTSAVLSPATAALADGDDIQARFILASENNELSAATASTVAAHIAVLTPATAALADGDDIRARFILTTSAAVR
jgi:hypothetical protein